MMKLICFDLDDTLWDFESCLLRAEEALHEWLEDQYPDFAGKHDMESLRERRQRLLAERSELRHDIGRVRWLAMKHAAESSGYSDADARRLAHAAFKKFMVHRNNVELFDDVMPALVALRRQYKLCSLTNGNADLNQIGMADLFHHNLSAESVGAAKPSAKMFHEACRLANVHPAEAVHIGDDPDHDVMAARDAGMKTVWINRKQADWPHATTADAEVRTLAELTTWLQTFSPVAV